METGKQVKSVCNMEEAAKDGYLMLHQFRLVSAAEGRAEMYVDLRPELCNPYGIVHGGVLFTICDYCAGIAAGTDHNNYVTLDASYHFMRNVRQGRLTAVGEVIKRGSSICVVHCFVQGEDGTQLTDGTFTMYRV